MKNRSFCERFINLYQELLIEYNSEEYRVRPSIEIRMILSAYKYLRTTWISWNC